MQLDLSRSRRFAALAAVGCMILLCVVGIPPSGAAKPPLSIKVVGNHFVNGSGHRIRLLGVNHTSAEYGCVDGFGYDDGHFDDADAAAIASWGADAVRVPLNEDCWLGINGQPNSNEGADPALTRAGYRREIANYVADLHRHGLYAILDLHWSAPGSQVALEQQPMPDEDHSPAFWTSVASTFKTDPAVVFDLFNEPFDPTDPKSGDDQNPGDKVTWNCWETGTHNGPAGGADCVTAAYDENGRTGVTYQVAGLQTLLDAVRDAGARQPVLTGGLDYANDLGEKDHGGEWMTHAPDDPRNQEAASFHNYMGKVCDDATCWKGSLVPIAKHVPVVTGEFDEDNFDEAKCAQQKPSTFDARYMKWADTAGVSYLAWGWIVESKAERDADGCDAYYLIDSYRSYRPSKPNGVALHDHLRALVAAAEPKVTLTSFHAAVGSGDKTVVVTLRSPETARGTLTARTVDRYAAGAGEPHRVALGSAKIALAHGTAKAVRLTVSGPARSVLADHHSVKVVFTLTLTSTKHRRTVIHRTSTLQAQQG